MDNRSAQELEKYRNLFNKVEHGICLVRVIFTPEGKGWDYMFLEYNDKFTQHSGLKDVVGKTMREVVPDIENVWAETYGEVAKTGEPAHFQQHSPTLGRWFDASAYRLGETADSPVAILFTDITREKEAEQKLTEQGRFTENLVEAIPSLVYVFDLELNKNIYASPQVEALLGYTPEEVQASGDAFLPSVFHPDDLAAIAANMQSHMAQGSSSIYSNEYRMKHKNGQWVWLFDRNRVFERDPNGKPLKILGVATDITDRKLLEEQLYAKFAELDNLYRMAPIGLGLISKDLKFIRINERLAEINGVSVEGHIGRSIYEIVPDISGQVEKYFRHILDTGEPVHNVEIKGETKADPGVERIWTESWNPVFGPAGDVIAISVLVEEITERKRAEEALKASEQRFKNLIWDAEIAIIVLTGPEMKVEIVNRSYGKLVGLEPDELEGQSLFDIVPDARKQYLPLLEQVRTSGQPLYLFSTPYSVMTKGVLYNGYLDVVYQPYRDLQGNTLGVMAILQDVTEAVEARQALEASEARFRSVVEEAPVATSLFTGLDLRVDIANDLMLSYWGKGAEVMGVPLADAVPELKGQPFLEILRNVYTSGESFSGKEMPATLNVEGEMRTSYFDFTYKPMRDEHGQVYGILNMAVDVTERVNARKELEESEKRFRYLANDTPAFMFMGDGDANVEFVNDQWLRFAGFSDVEGAGRAWASITHPDDVAPMLCIYEEAVARGKAYQFEIRQRRADGVYRWVLWKGIPRADAQGRFAGVMGVGLDITEQKEAEQIIRKNEERFRQLTDLVPQKIWTANPDGYIDFYNKRWYEYTGQERNIKGDPGWLTLLHEEDRQQVFDAWYASIRSGRSYQIEFRLKNRNGAYKWFLAKALPVRDDDGTIVKWFGTTTDIHSQKTIAEQLEELVAQRTQDLLRSNEDLQQFAHVASHDLREPVRKIKTFLSRILHECEDQLPEKAVGYMSKIDLAATRMTSMIDGVLAYSSIDAVQGKEENVNLNAVMGNIIEDLELIVHKKNADVQYKALDHVKGNPVLIYQLFYNLMTNALKFSKEDRRPEISIRTIMESDGRMVRVLFRDNGIGFDQQYAENIFKTFVRLNPKDKYEGTGLGLSLCRKIVERCGGSIMAHSKEGEGTMFEILLPAA